MLLALSGCLSAPADLDSGAPPPAGGPRSAVDDGGTAGPQPSDAELLPDLWSDVPIVIGAGPSGLAVAMDLGEALVLEASDVIGGRARWAGGFLYMVGTEEQAAIGTIDTPELAAADWEALTGAAPTSATRTFLAATDGIRDRLVGMGLVLRLDRPEPVTGHLRLHAPTTLGVGLVETLAANLPEGVEVRLSTPVHGLVFVDGRAAGVRTDAGWIGADTVIVASGGFVDRADLVELHTGWGPGTWRAGDAHGADGAAVDWASASGLGTAHLDAVGAYRDVLGIAGADGQAMGRTSSFAFPWVWVDGSGTRFVDESATWSVLLSGLVDSRSNVWAVTTHESIAAAVSEADRPLLVEGEAWRCADDYAALAEEIGVDSTALPETMASVAELRTSRAADPLGRSFSTFPSTDGAPCAFRPGSIAAKNFGGLAVDDDGRVLDAAGAVVPGLWAVGEAAGMGVPGLGGAWGFDGSLSAVLWSGWRTAAGIHAER
ncbi:MAG: FAD-binding protein [Pseudomonadota bacterium]|nr:FAD-binding protein [Pseudomonadota bacterium]